MKHLLSTLFTGKFGIRRSVYLQGSWHKSTITFVLSERGTILLKGVESFGAPSAESRGQLQTGIDLRLEIRTALFLLNEFKRGFEFLRKLLRQRRRLTITRLGKLLTFMTAHWNLEGNRNRR